MKRSHNQLLGNAGEYFIAFQLARRGLNPAILGQNSQDVDILATDGGQTVVNIQVRTSAGRNQPRRWDVGRHRPNHSKNFFYVFINMWDQENKEIEYFIVHSKWVCENVDWEKSRPQFIIKNDDEYKRFLYNWESITSLFDKIT